MRVDRQIKRSVRKSRKNLLLVAGVVSVLCAVVSYGKIKLETKEAVCRERLEELSSQLAEEEKRTEEIEDYKTYVQTKKFIEEEAREKLGLVYPDEIIFESED